MRARIFQRGLSATLILALLLALVCILPLRAHAEALDSITISFGDATGTAGEVAYVPVTIGIPAGTEGYRITVYLNAEGYQVVNTDSSNGFATDAVGTGDYADTTFSVVSTSCPYVVWNYSSSKGTSAISWGFAARTSSYTFQSDTTITFTLPVLLDEDCGDSVTVTVGDSSRGYEYWYLGATKYDSYNNMTVTPGTITVASNETTYAASLETGLTADENGGYTVSTGDTFTVDALLTPSAAAELASGSISLTYDADLLTCTGAAANETDIGSGARASFDSAGTATASFTTDSGSEVAVDTDGLVLASYTFVANAAGSAVFSITDAQASETGSATGAAVTAGENLTVVIEKRMEAVCQSYGSDYALVQYTADALPAEGNAYFVDGAPLTYVPAYGGEGEYVFVALATEEPDSLKVTEAAGSYETLTAGGDVNGDGATNIVDAQVIIYMTAGTFTSATEGLNWLEADVNGSGALDAADAQMIQYFVHYGAFGTFVG